MKESTWTMLGTAVTSYASSQATISAGDAAAGAYGVQAQQSERAADWAIEKAKLNNIKLKRVYNETAASQAATFAAQGRTFSSGSVQNIIKSDLDRLEWDMDFNMTDAERQAQGYREDAQGYLNAGGTAQSSAQEQAGLGLLGTAISIGSAVWGGW